MIIHVALESQYISDMLAWSSGTGKAHQSGASVSGNSKQIVKHGEKVLALVNPVLKLDTNVGVVEVATRL